MFVLTLFRFLSRLLIGMGAIFFSISIKAQKKWDGGGGDNLWTTAANWSDNTVPTLTDNILLDNSLLPGSYNVQLPSIAVTVGSLTLVPSESTTIQFILPASNTAIPGFTVNGPGGIAISNGGVFINSSGGSPGTAIVVMDSIRIFNGGRFIHNTSNGHATYVSRLSRAPGTEKGIFTFDVPGAASYTISLSGRTYGSLELSAAAAGGTKSYLSNGITTAFIRGDFITNYGVNYSLDFTGDFWVYGSLLNNGNFNLASGPNNNSLKIRQQFFCNGTITESSTGGPVIELTGNTNQDISVLGTIQNSVTFRMNNPAGATLVSSVSLPYRLELLNGKITTTNFRLLTLQPNCSIKADSTTNTSFINGPLQKLGLINTALFLFPVGKGTIQRWVELKNASGNFTVEFYKNSAYSLSVNLGNGIDHLSQIEYWKIVASSGALANVELSFDNVNSGGVTDVNTLRVAQLSGGSWVNAGNIGTTGSAGAAGSVISDVRTLADPVADYFTLSGSESSQNPLPVEFVDLTVQQIREDIQLMWRVNKDLPVKRFEIEYSQDGRLFKTLQEIKASGISGRYIYLIRDPQPGTHYYRIRVIEQAGNSFCSKTVTHLYRQEGVYLERITLTDAPGNYRLELLASQKTPITFYVVNGNGQLVKKISVLLIKGRQEIKLVAGGLAAGLYLVYGENGMIRSNLLKFIKY